ncbi:MAG: ATP-binding protein, partial [Thermosynechococcaceae cyanobacterium]
MNWPVHSQHQLGQAVTQIRLRLEQYVNPELARATAGSTESAVPAQITDLGTSALTILAQTFNLSPLEQEILIVCACAELDYRCYELLSQLSGQSRYALPNLHLVLSLSTHGTTQVFDRSLPLFRWKLVDVSADARANLIAAPLKIDPWALQFLMGLPYNDPTFGALTHPQLIPIDTDLLSDSSHTVINQILAQWNASDSFPPLQLCSNDPNAQRALFAIACQHIGAQPYSLNVNSLPTQPPAQQQWILDWQRKAMVYKRGLFIQCHDPTKLPSTQWQILQELLTILDTPLVLGVSERIPQQDCPLYAIDIPSLTVSEQLHQWRTHLNFVADRLDNKLKGIVAQFNLSASAIKNISEQAVAQLEQTYAETPDPSIISEALWQICRTQSRAKLEGLVERQEPKTTWDELILPDLAIDTLKRIIAAIQHRSTVYDDWQMGGNTHRGKGVTALFYGPPGTGKTTAAEIIAKDLDLDLYRVDLSQVISKYIGETEKNLKVVFDAAEMSGAVLLFDEADAVIGKRNEVKDSKDQYANQTVSYLLQRMEAYSGLAILTTNLPNAIDSAFMRRIRFSVRFEYHNIEQRV